MGWILDNYHDIKLKTTRSREKDLWGLWLPTVFTLFLVWRHPGVCGCLVKYIWDRSVGWLLRQSSHSCLLSYLTSKGRRQSPGKRAVWRYFSQEHCSTPNAMWKATGEPLGNKESHFKKNYFGMNKLRHSDNLSVWQFRQIIIWIFSPLCWNILPGQCRVWRL